MIAKFYIHTGGGLGDIIKHYFWGHYGWKYTQSIKEQYPESKIKLLVTCSNPAGNELFKFHPDIDEIEAHPWQNPNKKWENIHEHTSGYKNLTQVHNALDNITSSMPDTIHLGKNDTKEIIKYKPKEKFIVMHPFAGDTIRTPMSLQQYFTLAQQLANKLPYKIVILGGTSQRVIGKTSRRIEENFPYEGDGIINLVNKITTRTAVRLTQLASDFIGTNSCLFCVRLALKQTRMICSKQTHISQVLKRIENVLG